MRVVFRLSYRQLAPKTVEDLERGISQVYIVLDADREEVLFCLP